MKAPPIREGEALALVRPLRTRLDPLSLYAALSDGGQRRETMLIERSDGPSLILDQAAVRVECRGQRVVVTACSAGGGQAVSRMAEALSAHVVARRADAVDLLFPRTTSLDAAERLSALSPFDVLRFLASGFAAVSREEPFTLAALGTVAFDHVDLFEDLPPAAEDRIGYPDFLFWLAESLVVIEQGGAARAVATAFGGGGDEGGRAYFDAADRLRALEARCEGATPFAAAGPAPAVRGQVDADLSDAEYQSLVLAMKEHIAAGEVYQIVPSRTFSTACPDPIGAFAALRLRDPSPYLFFIAAPDHTLFGASPETSVRVFAGEDGHQVEVKPIAGTRPRGESTDEDDRLEADMRLDPKELAEHMMLVDLARNDVARVSARGSRRVARLLTVERYARVMHLVSSVVGRLAPGQDAVRALQACLNVGTLTGAPKIRATELLRLGERTKRGPYGGAVGWLNGAGMLDTGVVIRSALVRGGTAFVRAGAGVVHDSDPQAEADETRRKASAILNVLAGAEAAA
jgi:anthranilate synthase component I